MTILERFRNRPSREAADAASAEPSSAGGPQLPIARYDQLDDQTIVKQLAQLSQADLTAVETHERSHKDRPAVLGKLRYLRANDEPVPGYDALEIEGALQVLAGADGEKLRAVRDYERKFKHRKAVLDEIARMLPTAKASAGEERARDEKTARIREGFAGRAKTASGLADDEASPAAPGPAS